MHARELIELAGLVAAHGPLLIEDRDPLADEHVERYWVTSQTRLDRWAHSLKEFAAGGIPDRPDPPAKDESPSPPGEPPSASRLPPSSLPSTARVSARLRGVLEEILVSEVLTRVWTAVLCAHDACRGAEEAGPAARSVLLGHIEARHRALSLVVQAERRSGENGESRVERERRGVEDPPLSPLRLPRSHVPLGVAVRANSLRRRAERWTDVLLGHLAADEAARKGTGPAGPNGTAGAGPETAPSPSPLSSLLEFAADRGRAQEFAEELRHRGASERRRLAWPLLMASLRSAFQRGLEAPSPNADLNARIAGSIIACFPTELFAGSGVLHSVWMMQLMSVADDAQGMLDQLLAPPRPALGDRPFFTRKDRLG
jgi:hypothetical protein